MYAMVRFDVNLWRWKDMVTVAPAAALSAFHTRRVDAGISGVLYRR